MSDPKPLASLSAGLLARKGAARPAMRRQVALTGMHTGFSGQDDLGWNDMGYDVDPHHTLAEDTRPGAHGLSPMHGSEPDAEVRNALNDAVERASVNSIVPAAPVPTEAEPPVVHQQQQRIVDEIAPPSPVLRPVEVAEPVVSAPPLAQTAEPVVETAPEAPAPELAVVLPIARPERAVAVKPAKVAKPPRAVAGTKGAFAFTLRLDPERHLRLRLASATCNRSAQAILIGLVDAYLADQPEIAAFAARLPATTR